MEHHATSSTTERVETLDRSVVFTRIAFASPILDFCVQAFSDVLRYRLVNATFNEAVTVYCPSAWRRLLEPNRGAEQTLCREYRDNGRNTTVGWNRNIVKDTGVAWSALVGKIARQAPSATHMHAGWLLARVVAFASGGKDEPQQQQHRVLDIATHERLLTLCALRGNVAALRLAAETERSSAQLLFELTSRPFVDFVKSTEACTLRADCVNLVECPRVPKPTQLVVDVAGIARQRDSALGLADAEPSRPAATLHVLQAAAMSGSVDAVTFLLDLPVPRDKAASALKRLGLDPFKSLPPSSENEEGGLTSVAELTKGLQVCLSDAVVPTRDATSWRFDTANQVQSFTSLHANLMSIAAHTNNVALGRELCRRHASGRVQLFPPASSDEEKHQALSRVLRHAIHAGSLDFAEWLLFEKEIPLSSSSSLSSSVDDTISAAVTNPYFGLSLIGTEARCAATPLHAAAQFGAVEMFRLLWHAATTVCADATAKAAAARRQLDPTLIVAPSRGSVGDDGGADVVVGAVLLNALDNNGLTPLHIGVGRGHALLVREMLSPRYRQCLDVNRRSVCTSNDASHKQQQRNRGFNAIDFAFATRNDAMIRLLQRAGGKLTRGKVAVPGDATSTIDADFALNREALAEPRWAWKRVGDKCETLPVQHFKGPSASRLFTENRTYFGGYALTDTTLALFTATDAREAPLLDGRVAD